jgi:hypothetical protein
METIKNFFIGLIVIIAALIIGGILMLAWPLILGIGSALLSIAAVILLIVLIFYVISLVGHLTRQILKKK